MLYSPPIKLYQQTIFPAIRQSHAFIALSVCLVLTSMLLINDALEKNQPFQYLPNLNPNRSAHDFDPIPTRIKKFARSYYKCDKNITLSKFTHEDSESNQLFFLETSGRTFIKGRQMCSIESAALMSELKLKIILKSPVLDLSKSRSLCHIFYSYDNVGFYALDFKGLLRDTPAEGLEERVARVVGHQMVHTSDIARLALAYKYGGFYLDLDIIVLRSLKELHNFLILENGKPSITMSESDKSCHLPSRRQRGQKLNNGQMHFSAGHPFTRYMLMYLNQTYDPDLNWRFQAGPQVCTAVVKEMYGLAEVVNMQIESSEDRSFNILPDFTFMPASFSRIKELLWPRQPKSTEEWNDLFRCSYAVHYHSHVFGSIKATGDPEKDFLSFLAPKLCPISYQNIDEV